MKDLVDIPAPDLIADPAMSNPRAASVRLKTLTMSRAKSQRSHDYRKGVIPNYVDQDRMPLNRTLVELRPLTRIRAENIQLREKAGRQRKIKSNAAVVLMGVITFGHMAAEEFNTLTSEQQDQAFRKLAEEIAVRLKTTVESLVIHLDETTIHAHFMLRGYDDEGNAVSDTIRLRTTSEIQDMTHAVMSGFCPGIERGHRKRDRLEAGADYADTLHRSVRQLHQDIPAEIAAKQDHLVALEQQAAELQASADKTREYIRRLTEDQRELTAKEEKRLKTYEGRLQKKDAELAELSARQEAERCSLDSLKQDLATRQEAVSIREEETDRKEEKIRTEEQANADETATVATERAAVEVDRERVRAAEIELSSRELAAETKAAEADRTKADYDKGIAGLESVLDQISDGTMRINPTTSKVTMANQDPLRAMPRPLRERLMAPALRLVRMIHDTEQRFNRLGSLMERVKAWLGRDDLAIEARKDGEEIDRDFGMG